MKHRDMPRRRKTPTKVNSLSSTPEAKAERLRRIRHLANLSREAMCSDGDINLRTLISWEVGRFGGISTKGAERVVKRVAKEGVFCNPEWLLYEIGAAPEVRVNYKKLKQLNALAPSDHHLSSENTMIVKELMLFKQHNKHSLDFIVNDDSMLPHYKIGDYVAGTQRFGDNIKTLFGTICIIQIKEGPIMMRILQPGPRNNSFNLIATNLNPTLKHVLIYDVELISAAPIIWHRRKDPLPLYQFF